MHPQAYHDPDVTGKGGHPWMRGGGGGSGEVGRCSGCEQEEEEETKRAEELFMHESVVGIHMRCDAGNHHRDALQVNE